MLTAEETALIDCRVPLATESEKEALKLYRSGAIHRFFVLDNLRRFVGCFVFAGDFPFPLRPDDAPPVSDEQRAEILRLAQAAGLM